MKLRKINVTVEVVVDGTCADETHAAMAVLGKDLTQTEDTTFHVYNAVWDVMRKAETEFEGDWSIGVHFSITHPNH